MTSNGEGLFIATAALMQAMIMKLAAKAVLSPSEIADLVGEAEEYIAGISPELMSPAAREFARRFLQQLGRASGAQ